MSDQIDKIDNCKNIADLRECVEQFLGKNSEIVAKLEELSLTISSHSTNCNIAKTVGTSVSGVGTVTAVTALGMAFAPLTFGLSLPLLWVGSAIGIAGAATTVGTSIVDSVKSNTFIKELTDLIEQKKECAEDLNEKFSKFTSVLYIDINDIIPESDDVLKVALPDGIRLANSSIKVIDLFGDLKVFNASSSVSNSAKILESIRQLNAMGVIKNGQILFNDFMKNVMRFGAPADRAGLDLFIRTTGPTIGSALMRSASAVTGIAFTVVDVYSLVSNWNKHQPTIDEIQRLIEQMKNEAKTVGSVVEFINLIDKPKS